MPKFERNVRFQKQPAATEFGSNHRTAARVSAELMALPEPCRKKASSRALDSPGGQLLWGQVSMEDRCAGAWTPSLIHPGLCSLVPPDLPPALTQADLVLHLGKDRMLLEKMSFRESKERTGGKTEQLKVYLVMEWKAAPATGSDFQAGVQPESLNADTSVTCFQAGVQPESLGADTGVTSS